MSALTDTSARRLRVVVLWAELSGYVHAELTALASRGVDLMVFHELGSDAAPFDAEAVSHGIRTHGWSGSPDEAEIEAMVADIEPDVLLVMSWNVGAYRRVARRWRGRALRVLCMDNQWWGTAKQWGGVAVSRLVIGPSYDAAFVAGQRQADFARRLGFASEDIVWGVYTCDHPRFAAVAAEREGEMPPEAFLYVGRLAPEKGIDVLVEGYESYRDTTAEPWPLLVAGTGPDAALLADRPGVEALGFVQPADLPGVFARAGCLVLPSRFEPWAVVVHEAAAAGLPVVCTWVCGASTRLVLDGYNGAVISPGDASAVAEGLGRIARATVEERRAMGAASELLAGQLTPARWADNLLRRIPDLRRRAGLPPVEAALSPAPARPPGPGSPTPGAAPRAATTTARRAWPP